MIKLSQTSKLGCKSWSLAAIETCPGARKTGGLVDACSGCYATTGAYIWPASIALRAHNKEDWKRYDWINDMVKALKKQKYFRWFDSGDMYTLELALKIYNVMALTPDTKHWLPTRMAKFPKFHNVINNMKALPNVMVRVSSDSVMGEFTDQHGSTIFPKGQYTPQGVFECSAYTNKGQCGSCRACWDKGVPVIGYPSHGHKMTRVIKLKEAA